MSTETKIAPTLPVDRGGGAASAAVACTDYPYLLVRMGDGALGGGVGGAMGGVLVRWRARVGRWLVRRRLERSVARARVVIG